MRKNERRLDGMIDEGAGSNDPELQELAETADQLRAQLSVDAPGGRQLKAMFVQAAAARGQRHLMPRMIAPALAMLAILGALSFFGYDAPPGTRLFEVRKALSRVGLAEGPVDEARDLIQQARVLIEEAETLVDLNPEVAEEHAREAIALLEGADELLDEVEHEDALDNQIDVLQDAAEDIEDKADDRNDREDNDVGDDDNSGPGSGDDGRDNSGPGSGDDDNSGSGSDDSDGGNTGPGSEDSGGSGSGDDDSGSGSDNSGSG